MDLTIIVRPYEAKTAGIPIHFQYEMNTHTWVNSTPNPASQTHVKGQKSIYKPPRAGSLLDFVTNLLSKREVIDSSDTMIHRFLKRFRNRMHCTSYLQARYATLIGLGYGKC